MGSCHRATLQLSQTLWWPGGTPDMSARKGSSRVRSVKPESQAAVEKKQEAPVLLDFLAQRHPHAAEDLAQGLEEGIAEGLDAERVDAADALRLDQAALDAGHHGPDVAEGDAGEEEAPQESDGDPEDRRQDAVAPVLGHGEGGVAQLPHPVQAVGAFGLGDHVLKLHLRGENRLEVRNTQSALCFSHLCEGYLVSQVVKVLR